MLVCSTRSHLLWHGRHARKAIVISELGSGVLDTAKANVVEKKMRDCATLQAFVKSLIADKSSTSKSTDEETSLPLEDLIDPLFFSPLSELVLDNKVVCAALEALAATENRVIKVLAPKVREEERRVSFRPKKERRLLLIKGLQAKGRLPRNFPLDSRVREGRVLFRYTQRLHTLASEYLETKYGKGGRAGGGAAGAAAGGSAPISLTSFLPPPSAVKEFVDQFIASILEDYDLLGATFTAVELQLLRGLIEDKICEFGGATARQRL